MAHSRVTHVVIIVLGRGVVFFGFSLFCLSHLNYHGLYVASVRGGSSGRKEGSTTTT
jgi:uncharacterized membrane protein YhhN